MAKRRRRSQAADDVYVQGIVSKGADGLNELHVCVGAKTAERLEAGMRAGFEQLLRRHVKREDFSGRVNLVVLSEVTPQTPEMWETVARVEQELRAGLEASPRTTSAGHQVALTFQYTGGEGH